MQKNIRLLQITVLFMLVGIIIGFSNTHSSVTVRAQNAGITPTLYCLAAGCNNLTPTVSSPPITTNSTNTIPAAPSLLPQLSTAAISPVVSPSQPCDSHDSYWGNNGKGGRGGFLKDIFNFFILLLELILKVIGAGNLSQPCSSTISTPPTPTNTPIPPVVQISPSLPATATPAASIAPSSPAATSSSSTVNTGIGTGGSIFTGGPFGNTCNPGQLYCNGHVITGGTNNTLYNCQPHSAPSVQQTCPGACKVNSTGNDSC
ncbi:MAG: hypothetical protein ACREHC_03120 [Candidatus Levyibacteriota bacterium]